MKPPLYSPRRTPLIHTVEAVIAPSKSTKTRLPLAACRHFETAAIGGDELVILVVEAVPGQLDVGMGNDDWLEGRVVERRQCAPSTLRGDIASCD